LESLLLEGIIIQLHLTNQQLFKIGKPMIRCENLNYQYDSGKGIHDISSEIAQGVTALIGRNGAGKTTMIEILCGIKSPDSGRIYIDGIEVDPSKDVKWKSQLGYCPSNHLFVGFMTIEENFQLIGKMRCGDSMAWEEHRDIIRRFGCIDYIEKIANEVSAGQLRRAMIISALIGNPKLLIFDEPGNDLDIEGIYILRDLIRDLQFDHSIIISTHILDVIRDLELRTIFLEEGKIIYDSDDSEELLKASEIENLYQDFIWNQRAISKQTVHEND
jgi:ABC-2 type transport system ATP-binding protein